MTASRAVVIGADTHLDATHLAAITETGKPLGDAEFPTRPAGYYVAVKWAQSFGAVLVAGVEGTASYGRGIDSRVAGRWCRGRRSQPPRPRRPASPGQVRSARCLCRGPNCAVWSRTCLHQAPQPGWRRGERGVHRLDVSCLVDIAVALPIRRDLLRQVVAPLRGGEGQRAELTREGAATSADKCGEQPAGLAEPAVPAVGCRLGRSLQRRGIGGLRCRAGLRAGGERLDKLLVKRRRLGAERLIALSVSVSGKQRCLRCPYLILGRGQQSRRRGRRGRVNCAEVAIAFGCRLRSGPVTATRSSRLRPTAAR